MSRIPRLSQHFGIEACSVVTLTGLDSLNNTWAVVVRHNVHSYLDWISEPPCLTRVE